jgi:hypothetical protein
MENIGKEEAITCFKLQPWNLVQMTQKSRVHFKHRSLFQICIEIYILLRVKSVTLDGFWIGYSNTRLVTTRNYNGLTELHTPNITVTTAHIKSSLCSLDVFW